MLSSHMVLRKPSLASFFMFVNFYELHMPLNGCLEHATSL